MSAKNYAHQLDAKNRMRIPAKLREELGSNYSITVDKKGNVRETKKIEY